MVGHVGETWSVEFSPDGRHLVTGGSDRTARLWAVLDDSAAVPLIDGRSLKWIDLSEEEPHYVVDNHRGGLRFLNRHGDLETELDMDLSPTSARQRGDVLITRNFADIFEIWRRTKRGNWQLRWTGTDLKVGPALAISPDGKKVLGTFHWLKGENDDRLRGKGSILYDLDGRQLVRRMNHETHIFMPHASFSPSGDRIVTACYDGMTRVWNCTHGRLEFTIDHKVGVSHAEFSPPSGAVIVTTCLDGTARLWDSQTEKLLHTFDEHGGAVTSCAFSPDGRMIATGSQDGAILVWDRNGDVSHRFRGHETTVHYLGFDPTGPRLLSASFDGPIRSWLLDRDELLRQAVERVEAGR